MLNLSEKDVDTEEGLGWRVWEQVLEEGVECTALAKTLPGKELAGRFFTTESLGKSISVSNFFRFHIYVI